MGGASDPAEGSTVLLFDELLGAEDGRSRHVLE